MRQLTILIGVTLGLFLSACGGSSTAGDALLDQVQPDGIDVDTGLPDLAPTDISIETPECTIDSECEGRLALGPCQVAGCDASRGVCVPFAIADHTFCDDGDKCTLIDTCLSGECVGSGGLDCDDGNPCTDDTCDPEVGGRGCVHSVTTGAPCDDGNLCTTGDACDAGKCLGNDAGCACGSDADCQLFEDANLCNGSLTCDAGKCQVDGATVITCDTQFDGPCERTACQPLTGLCAARADDDGAPCDDGNPCSTGDHCAAGACLPGDYDCEPCTADAECAPFDDADLCNGRVRCLEGQCQILPGSVPACSSTDDTQCRTTLCLPGTGACQSVAKADAAACSDGNMCSVGDRCQAGQCVAGSARTCHDANPCTDDTCDPSAGCVFAFVQAPCDDGNACTLGDTCSQGACVGPGARDCDDGNPCTLDACVPSTGCVSTPNTEACDDGNPCTLADQCSGGVCLAGTNECPCATDVDCEAFDDGDRCDGVLVCVAERCVLKPNSIITCDTSEDTQCRVNVCAPDTGLCGFVTRDDGSACSDGDACTIHDACTDGACLPGKAAACGDGDPCTVDSCSPALGCVHEAIPDCTGCANDAACLDADPCTADLCVVPDCQHPAIDGLPCDDGDACTFDDTCVGGACIPGLTNVCAGVACEAIGEVVCEQSISDDPSAEGATDAIDTYGCNSFHFDGPERIYHFAPAVSGLVTFTLADEQGLYVNLLEDQGQGCRTSNCVGSHTLEVAFAVEGGRDYYVAVDGYAGAAEPFTLKVDCAWTAPEACTDHDDNDLDGLIDCDDPDCATSFACHEAACANAADDDHDGATDCDDPDCFFDGLCTGGWSGDTCEDSFVLNGGVPFDATWLGRSLVRHFTTAGATDDLHGGCQGDAGGPDVAWVFELAEPLRTTLGVAFDGDGALGASALYVYAAPLCVPEYELACVTTAAGLGSITRSFEAGTYYVVVDGPEGQGGPFELTLSFSEPLSHELACADGVDDDGDGATDCDDVADCGQANLCSAVDACVPTEPVGCGQAVQGTLVANPDATNVITQYACGGETQFGYWGAESAHAYVATCTGQATATLTIGEPSDALVDLFLLDAAIGCASNACLGFANVRDRAASLQFAVQQGASYYLVADGYLGAAASYDLAVACTCDEVCDNDLDDDGDGLTDCDDEIDCAQGTPACPSSFELDCANDYDEDQDGDVDCADPDCAANAACPEVICSDLKDDDLDGKTDCADPDCASVLVCTSPFACVPTAALSCNVPAQVTTTGDAVTDAVRFWTGCDLYGLDYSGAESARSFVSPCTGEVEVRLADQAALPAGNLDVFVLDPADGCVGAACRQAIYGPGGGLPTAGRIQVTEGQALTLVIDGWQGYASTAELVVDCLCRVETCDDGIDNNGDGVTDCSDPGCAKHATCPETSCTDGLDNDDDGVTDCDDAPCAATPACPEVRCADGLDENHDGATDCADASCFASPYCTAGHSGESCTDPFLLNDGLVWTAADSGRVETRWNTLWGAAPDHESLVACAGWTQAPDRVYHISVATDLVLHATLTLSGQTLGGLVLFSAAWGCDGANAPEFALGCAPAQSGVASLSEVVVPGDYFLVVEGMPADEAAGAYRLDVGLSLPATELFCGDGDDDDGDGLADCADATDCGSSLLCQHPDVCAPAAGIACGSSVEGDLASNEATDAVSAYACIPSAGAAYHGPELTWTYTAACSGSVTATLTHLGTGSDLYFDLFVLEGAAACDGTACKTMGVFDDVTRKATVTFDVQLSEVVYLVADGFDGAIGNLKLDVSCACTPTP